MNEPPADNPNAINMAQQLGLAISLHQQGQLGQAQAIYEQLLQINPGHADALHLLGVIAYQTGQFGKATELIGRALAVSPGSPIFYANRGLAHQGLRQLDAAIADYGKVVSIKPDYVEAYNNRGLALRDLRQLDAAIADFTRAISIKPDYVEAYNNRGVTLRDLKKLDAAIADYTTAISLRPNSPELYNNRGVALRELKKLEAAVADYDKAIALRPDYAEAYNNRGDALQELKQLDAAVANYDKAISLKPDYAEAYYNRGNALREPRKLEAAIVDYGKAIAIKPDHALAYNNRGLAQQELKKLEAAIADYDKAVALKPDYADAYLNKALSLLLRGDLGTGFELYEWRWKNSNLNMPPRRFAQPLWLGAEPLGGKRILLHSEQGLGDTIQFCRYASLVARRGAQVILAVQQSLVELLKNLEGVSWIFGERENPPDFDYHCPLLSLPLAFRTAVDTIPDPSPYLHADAAKAREWQARIGERKRLKVGVVWSGGFRLNVPRGWDAVNDRRNVRLDMFARALSAIEADFFSLQKGDPAESEIRGHELEFWPRDNLHNFAGEIKDFSDTAALMANLDVVVTVDTSTAHLAAALGKPTWILNRFDTDWRWLLDRDDSPWYRSVKLYRQDESQDWEPVLQRLAADLTTISP